MAAGLRAALAVPLAAVDRARDVELVAGKELELGSATFPAAGRAGRSRPLAEAITKVLETDSVVAQPGAGGDD